VLPDAPLRGHFADTGDDPVNGTDPLGLCNQATVSCVIGILSGTESLPDGFLAWENARNGLVGYVATTNGVQAELVTGGCSVPVLGDRVASFSAPCKTHDLGYDLIRCFDSSGPNGSIRKAVDNFLFNDLKAVVSAKPFWDKPGGAILARIYYEAVSANSFRQHYDVP
jgi:hypothetical protein